ncbi:hypothetical protein [Pedobacter sp. GR22-6]|uniref:hypothetical protein n=1 Tax=Pedobacter sp. GR22-6 TaxID=3127957 RepID=UPI00307E6D24
MKTQKEKLSPLVKKPGSTVETKQLNQAEEQLTSAKRPKPAQRPNYLLQLL